MGTISIIFHTRVSFKYEYSLSQINIQCRLLSGVTGSFTAGLVSAGMISFVLVSLGKSGYS